MYSPIYTISNKILKNIGYIEGSKEVIDIAPLVPSFEKQFQSDALMRIIHHGSHFEGNELTLYQVKKVLDGAEVYGKARDIQEIINYKNLALLVDEISIKNNQYDKGILSAFHRASTEKLIVPEKMGMFRQTEVVVKDEYTGEVIFSPPPAVELPYLIDDFLGWLNDESAKDVHPVIKAGISQYILGAIFPFVNCNYAVTRSFVRLILLREGYGIKGFFTIEEQIDINPTSYYENLDKIDKQSASIGNKDLTTWIEYFTGIFSDELVKIKERVKKMSIDNKMKVKFGDQIALSERQMRLIEYVTDRGSAGMGELRKVLPMVSEDTVLRELQDLTKKGIIKKQGSTKASKYVLANK